MPPAPNEIRCFFDGACKGNQFAKKGAMWAAYVVGDEEHMQEVPDLSSPRGPLRSNNIAEYQAVILLLRRLRDLTLGRGGTRFLVFGDSQLVVYQLEGWYRVQEPHLQPLCEEARDLASALSVTFRWVPREKNRAGHLLERT